MYAGRPDSSRNRKQARPTGRVASDSTRKMFSHFDNIPRERWRHTRSYLNHCLVAVHSSAWKDAALHDSVLVVVSDLHHDHDGRRCSSMMMGFLTGRSVVVEARQRKP